MRTLFLSVGLVLGLSFSMVPGAEAGSETAGYIAAPPALLSASCPADSHTLLDGPGHSPPGPGPLEDPVAWLASYEHECTGNDGANLVREALGEEPRGFGYGAYPFVFASTDIGTLAAVFAEDVAYGQMSHLIVYVHTVDGEDEHAEGCGPQVILLPEDPEPDGFWGDYRLWAAVFPIHVDDDLEVCFGTTGELHASWGDA